MPTVEADEDDDEFCPWIKATSFCYLFYFDGEEKREKCGKFNINKKCFSSFLKTLKWEIISDIA